MQYIEGMIDQTIFPSYLKGILCHEQGNI